MRRLLVVTNRYFSGGLPGNSLLSCASVIGKSFGWPVSTSIEAVSPAIRNEALQP